MYTGVSKCEAYAGETMYEAYSGVTKFLIQIPTQLDPRRADNDVGPVSAGRAGRFPENAANAVAEQAAGDGIRYPVFVAPGSREIGEARNSVQPRRVVSQFLPDVLTPVFGEVRRALDAADQADFERGFVGRQAPRRAWACVRWRSWHLLRRNHTKLF